MSTWGDAPAVDPRSVAGCRYRCWRARVRRARWSIRADRWSARRRHPGRAPSSCGRPTPLNNSGTQSLVGVIGTDRAAAVAEMLAQLNARRAAIGVPLLTLSASLSDMAENWSDHLAAQGGSLVHQSPLPAGVYGETSLPPAIPAPRRAAQPSSETSSPAVGSARSVPMPSGRHSSATCPCLGSRGARRKWLVREGVAYPWRYHRLESSTGSSADGTRPHST